MRYHRSAPSLKPSFVSDLRRSPGSHPLLLRLLVVSSCMLGWAQLGWSEEVKDYGKPGSPINLVIGYQPYYTESWSGVIMRGKKFYEKYLPAGSQVDFQIGRQGSRLLTRRRP